jgi:hypothetical protein
MTVYDPLAPGFDIDRLASVAVVIALIRESSVTYQFLTPLESAEGGFLDPVK